MTDPTTAHDPTQPVHDPLAVPGVVCILLSEAAGRRLLLEGDAFAIVAKTSYPQIANRMAIYCQAITPDKSADLCRILRGGFHAVPTKVRPLREAPPPTEDATRTAYTRGSDGPTIRGQIERKRQHEVRDLQAIDSAVDSWLVEHGCDTSVGKWIQPEDEP